MAEEETVMYVDLLSELNSIKEEYSKLKTHLTDVELKYQKALTNKDDAESDDEKIFNECLRSTVSGLFNDKLYSDIVILLGNKQQIYGHKLILSSRCQKWGEKTLDSLNFLDLSDLDYRVGYSIMKWVYTNQIEVIEEEKYLVDLLQASYHYSLPTLRYRVEMVLLPYIDELNSQLFHDLSVKLGNNKIRIHCLQFLTHRKVENDDDVIVTIEPLQTGQEINTEKPTETDKPNTEIEKQSDTTKPKRGRKKGTKINNLKNKCNICNRDFKTATILAAHNEAHENQLEKYPEQKDLDPAKPFKFLRKRRDMNTTCEICNKQFATRFTLERHKLTHTNQGPVMCPHCDREYKTLDTLNHHIRYKHSGKNREKKHTCEECGNSFITESLLKRHQGKHTGVRPFKCSICDKTFVEKGQKVRHEKLHTGVRAFVCESCGFAFSEKGNLFKHIASVHRGEKHYSCDVCQKTFFRMDTLKKHQLMHTGEKPHMCQTCGRYFAMKSNMIKHQMVHTGVKPYKCNVCDKGFRERGHLRRHMKVHDNLKNVKDANGIEQVVLVVVKSEDDGVEVQESNLINENENESGTIQALDGNQVHHVEHEGQLLSVEGHIIVHVDNKGNLVDSQGNFIASHRVVLGDSQIINEGETIEGQTDPFEGQGQIVNVKNEFIKL